MDVDQVLSRFRYELRNLVRDGETVEARPDVTRRSWAAGELNEVTAHDLDSSDADAAIQAQIDYFKSLGKGFEWKVFSFDRPADLVERLRSAGFTVGDREALVVYDVADGLTSFEGPPRCEVRRVVTAEQLADFRQVAEAVFQKDYSLTTNELAEALATGRTGHDAYVAYVEGVPVAIGRLYTDPDSAFAGFYGGGTLPQFRGRGCYRAITAARACDAAAAGARYLQVDALPTSLPILLRLGFVRIADTWPCGWSFENCL